MNTGASSRLGSFANPLNPRNSVYIRMKGIRIRKSCLLSRAILFIRFGVLVFEMARTGLFVPVGIVNVYARGTECVVAPHRDGQFSSLIIADDPEAECKPRARSYAFPAAKCYSSRIDVHRTQRRESCLRRKPPRHIVVARRRRPARFIAPS